MIPGKTLRLPETWPKNAPQSLSLTPGLAVKRRSGGRSNTYDDKKQKPDKLLHRGVFT
tara:strand:+ start:183450 stop:183623 length:174 start_codon:yes stop_codon:yes gene_type:complete